MYHLHYHEALFCCTADSKHEFLFDERVQIRVMLLRFYSYLNTMHHLLFLSSETLLGCPLDEVSGLYPCLAGFLN